MPEWTQNIYHIPAEDEHPCKETNIYKKILLACQEKEVTENFLFFNDDHFILQDFNADEFPYYYKGELLQVLQKMKPYNKYSQCVYRTAHTLASLGHTTKNFDTHTPIIYNKQKFIDVMTKYDWTPRFSFVVKSLYSNTLGIEGIKEPDCKMNDQCDIEEFYRRIKERKVFSIGDGALGQTLETVLNQLYPNKSKWEK